MTTLRSRATAAAAGAPHVAATPANLRWMLTPDEDPALAWVDTLTGIDVLDDACRRATVDAALRGGN